MFTAGQLVNGNTIKYIHTEEKHHVYNILLTSIGKMVVNNMLVETLDPSNPIAIKEKRNLKINKKRLSNLTI